MNILILGAGRQGKTIVETLLEWEICKITVVDASEEALKLLSTSGVETIQVDINRINLPEFLGKYDLVIDALPARFGFRVMQASIEAGIPLIDITYSEENPLTLDKKAREKNIFIIPDAGFAPGISNLLVGYGLSLWHETEGISIKVGGIPLNPESPLNYSITWSPEDLIAEYTRPVKMRKEGKVVELEALSGIQTEYFEGVGYLESFYTDGLRTLLETIKEVPNLEERTLRYRGHAEIFKTLRELCFLDGENIHFTLKVLEKEFRKSSHEDMGILRVEFHTREGEKGFELIHRYNYEKKRTAMSELTGFPPAILAKFYIQGKLNVKGVVPLEILGKDKEFTEEFLHELELLGVKIHRYDGIRRELPRRIEKKILPVYFEKILSGEKTFEIRLADFECKPGDILVLKEWDPKRKKFTGRKIEKIVTYVLKTKDLDFWEKEDIERYGYQIIGFK